MSLLPSTTMKKRNLSGPTEFFSGSTKPFTAKKVKHGAHDLACHFDGETLDKLWPKYEDTSSRTSSSSSSSGFPGSSSNDFAMGDPDDPHVEEVYTATVGHDAAADGVHDGDADEDQSDDSDDGGRIDEGKEDEQNALLYSLSHAWSRGYLGKSMPEEFCGSKVSTCKAKGALLYAWDLGNQRLFLSDYVFDARYRHIFQSSCLFDQFDFLGVIDAAEAAAQIDM